MRLSEIGRKFYRHIANQPVFATAFFGIYRSCKRMLCLESRPARGRTVPAWSGEKPAGPKVLERVKVAMIGDDMTWENLRRECEVTALTPHNWKKVLCQEKPDVLFCESAWTGLKAHGGCWHGVIYRNHNILFDNRKELLRILAFCRKYRIPTVFWNKEDPAFFDSDRYDFTDTALKFDWIFTTAAECVPGYQKKGHRQVGVMMFGFSPYLFSPLNCLPKTRRAVFAGSWIAEDQSRCQEMEQLFDLMQEQEIPLTIYDRQTRNTKEGRSYPEKYKKNVRECVPYEKMGQELKHVMYALNINTVTTSDTMFARRVFELAASNVIMVSNKAKGMQRLLSGGIRYLGEPFTEENADREARRNVDLVFAHHTNRIRFTEMFVRMGILPEPEKIKIGVLDSHGLLGGHELAGNRFVAVPCRSFAEMREKQFAYGIRLATGQLRTLDAVLPHFCYLPWDCGIRIVGEARYIIAEDAEHEDVVYPWNLFSVLLAKGTGITAKYLLGGYEE